MSKKWDEIAVDEDENRYAAAHKLAGHMALVGNVFAGSTALLAVGMIGEKLTIEGGMVSLQTVVIFSILMVLTGVFIRMVLHGVAAILRATADTASTNAEILEALKTPSSSSV